MVLKYAYSFQVQSSTGLTPFRLALSRHIPSPEIPTTARIPPDIDYIYLPLSMQNDLIYCAAIPRLLADKILKVKKSVQVGPRCEGRRRTEIRTRRLHACRWAIPSQPQSQNILPLKVTQSWWPRSRFRTAYLLCNRTTLGSFGKRLRTPSV